MERSAPVLHHNKLLFSSLSSGAKPNISSLPSVAPHNLHFYSANPLTSSYSPRPRCCTIARVSTSPVEYVPPAPEDFEFERELTRLRAIRSRLSTADGLDDKLRLINTDPRVRRFFNHSQSEISRALESLRLGDYELYLLKCVIAAGQEHVFGSYSGSVDHGFGSRGGALKTALYALVEMIEKWDGSADQSFGSNGHGRINGEKIDAVRMLLKTLREMEQFYDCIGGIIGLVSISSLMEIE